MLLYYIGYLRTSNFDKLNFTPMVLNVIYTTCGVNVLAFSRICGLL